MTRASGLLLALLIASNAAWLWHWAVSETQVHAHRVGMETTAHVPETTAHASTKRPAPRATSAPLAREPGAPSGSTVVLSGRAAAGPRAAGDAPSSPTAKAEARKKRAEEERSARRAVAKLRADILQVHDPGRRDRALEAMVDAIRSTDDVLVVAALHSLFEIHHAQFDGQALREAVRARLHHEVPSVREAAARALLRATPEPSDADLLLRRFAAHPRELVFLSTAISIARRVEGDLAKHWLAAFAEANAVERRRIVRMLDGHWVSEDVEAALIAGFRVRTDADNEEWFAALGGIQPLREERMRLIFEVIGKGVQEGTRHSDYRRLQDWLRDRGPHSDALKRLVGNLALELLREPPDGAAIRFSLDVLRVFGTAVHVRGLRAYADNTMVAPLWRHEAEQTAEQIERREQREQDD